MDQMSTPVVSALGVERKRSAHVYAIKAACNGWRVNHGGRMPGLWRVQECRQLHSFVVRRAHDHPDLAADKMATMLATDDVASRHSEAARKSAVRLC